jgi:hypothetical protein
LAGLSLHHRANCSKVTPYFWPYDHVTGRTNCKLPQKKARYFSKITKYYMWGKNMKKPTEARYEIAVRF